MNLSRRNFMKIAGLSAAAVAGAALFTGCSGQLMLPVRFSATVIGKETQKALDTQQFSVVADLSEDAQKNAINAFVRSQLRQPMYEVDFIERKTDTLDGKETDYLFVTLKTANGSSFLPAALGREIFRVPFCFDALQKTGVSVQKQSCTPVGFCYIMRRNAKHPRFYRKDRSPCEFVFIPSAARST